MTFYTSNRDGNGKTSEEGHYKFQTSVFSGNVLGTTALLVTQNTPLGMSVLVSPGQFKIDTGLDYAYTGWNTTSEPLAISTADAANPRITSVVLYIDKAAATSPSPPNNPNIAKLKAINGTPAASPVAPSGSSIQTSVGAGNPYIILANVTVPALASNIINANILDMRVQVVMGSNLVGPNSIQDSAVTTNKLANLSVSTAKLADVSVTTAKLANGSIDDTKWRNGIAFHASRSTTRNLSATTWTIMAPNSITYNYGGGYSNSGDIGRFTAPVTGVYSFTANVYTELTGQTRSILSFWLNGVSERSRVFDITSSANRRMNGTSVIFLNAGDYIDARVWLQTASNISHIETWFAGHLVTRA